MKLTLSTLLLLVLFVSIIRFAMADKAESKAPGLLNGQLQSCPDSPNCINTEFPESSSHYLPALGFEHTQSTQIIDLAKNIIIEMGGAVVNAEQNYLAATFTSTFFRFVDDFEIRIDEVALKLHIRSASRTGYSDFGVNKRRLEDFSKRFKAILQQ